MSQNPSDLIDLVRIPRGLNIFRLHHLQQLSAVHLHNQRQIGPVERKSKPFVHGRHLRFQRITTIKEHPRRGDDGRSFMLDQNNPRNGYNIHIKKLEDTLLKWTYTMWNRNNFVLFWRTSMMSLCNKPGKHNECSSTAASPSDESTRLIDHCWSPQAPLHRPLFPRRNWYHHGLMCGSHP